MMRAARQRAEREQQSVAWAVWHVVMLSRAKKIPEFEAFVRPAKGDAKRRQTPEEVAMNLKMLRAAWCGRVH